MEIFEWTGFRLEYYPDADTEHEYLCELYSLPYEDGDISLLGWDDLEDAKSDIGISEKYPMSQAEWQALWDWVLCRKEK